MGHENTILQDSFHVKCLNIRTVLLQLQMSSSSHVGGTVDIIFQLFILFLICMSHIGFSLLSKIKYHVK